jgi:hypothetical protein
LGPLFRDEAFLIAKNIAKPPSVPRQTLKGIPWPPNSDGTIEGDGNRIADDPQIAYAGIGSQPLRDTRHSC